MTLVVLFFPRLVRYYVQACIHALIASVSAEVNADAEIQPIMKGTMSIGLPFRAMLIDILRAIKFFAERSSFEEQKMYVATFLCVRRTLQERELKYILQPADLERIVDSTFFSCGV